MKISKAFPSRYLKAADLDGSAVALTISHVEREEVGNEKEQKPVLYFKDWTKGLVLNRTNAGAITAAYGDESEDWTGKPVEVFATTTQFRGTTVDCLRVRISSPGQSDEPPF